MNDVPPAVTSRDPVSELIQCLRSSDAAVRGPAWQMAGTLGARAVEPLARTMNDPDGETARAARRALWSVVDHAGRPGAEIEREAVTSELCAVVEEPALGLPARREAVWMLSTLGDPDAVDVVAARLNESDLREDARCALQRIPGGRATRALQTALAGAKDEFAAALADALRARGEVVHGRPSRRLVPTRVSAVATVGA